MKQVFVALGSNLDAPITQIERAFEKLTSLPSTLLVQRSSLYQTMPVDCPAEAPDFVNAVVELATTLAPLDLLQCLLELERQFGRVRGIRNSPRVLDCDLLMYEDVVCTSSDLILPHPQMHRRDFVLVPLLEIAPDCVHPSFGRMSALVHGISGVGVRRLR